MTRKSENCYKHVFNYIEQNVMSLECKSFMTDFEDAMRNGIASVWPNAERNTCWFHLCQAVKRRIVKNSALSKLIQTNPEARDIYKKILSLPLLPPELIVDAFYKLKAIAMTKFAGRFNSFFVYYERQWLQKV